MCRKSFTCNYVKPNEVPVDAPSIRPDEFDEYFTAFARAVTAAKADGWAMHQPFLPATHERALNEWFTEHAQMAATYRKSISRHIVPEGSTPDPDPLRAKLVREVNQRDNYRCRYCGNPALPASFFKKLTQMVGSEHFCSAGTNVERNGIKLVFSATADHLVPRVDGGKTDFSNLVTSCWPCNYGKANFTIKELGMTNPLERPVRSLDERVVELLRAIGRAQDLPGAQA